MSPKRRTDGDRAAMAKEIRDIRVRLGMSEMEMASALGLTARGDGMVRKWELGQVAPTSAGLTAIRMLEEMKLLRHQIELLEQRISYLAGELELKRKE